MKLCVLRLLALASVPALLVAGCGGDDDDDSATSSLASAEESAREGDITVFAAASLTDAFDEVVAGLRRLGFVSPRLAAPGA